MKAINVLFGGRLTDEAWHYNAVSKAISASSRFPGAEKTVFLGLEGIDYGSEIKNAELITKSNWTKNDLLEELSRLSGGEYHIYFSFADCPLLDPSLAGAIYERHIKYRAEYSYSDGWPYGFAPEILSPGTPGILASIASKDTGNDTVDRDILFSVIQKDINSFDIETEISPVDLRPWRLSFTTDSKRNLMLITRFTEAGYSTASDSEKFIKEKPELLRTLPAFFPIQVSGSCPQECTICPWSSRGKDIFPSPSFMDKENFSFLLSEIVGFAGDGIIDLSLWGELSLHPNKIDLIKMVLEKPELSLIVETSGIGWTKAELEMLADLSKNASPRKYKLATGCTSPLSWIVSLDAYEPERYTEVRGSGYAEAYSCARTLLEYFPDDTYVQAVRVKGYEDDIEQFYRTWKKEGPSDGKHIIIQKYSDFAGMLPKLQASDLSPVKRRACWHLKRDFNILLDGRVPYCQIGTFDNNFLGNALKDKLSHIWEKGSLLYIEHCKQENSQIENSFPGSCGNCDEYYTYNF